MTAPSAGVRRPLSILAAALLAAIAAPAQQAPERTPRQSHLQAREAEPLLGDWCGLRSDLAACGLDVELHYAIEVLAPVSGGRRRRAEVLGNLDLTLAAELGPLLGWDGARVFVYGLGNHGGNPSENIGDAQIASNIEAPAAMKVYEVWLEQDFLDGRASVLVGLHDLNGEFDVIPAALLFINSAHGIGSEFGNAGRNGPSIFPVTSLGARVLWRPTERWFARAGVWDGVPGDPGDPDGTHVILDDDDGVLLAGEVGFLVLPERPLVAGRTDERPAQERRYGRFGKYALGIWGFTGEFDDFTAVDPSGNPVQRNSSPGVYAFGEQAVWWDAADPSQGLSVFARAGIADGRVQLFDGYLGAGLVYRGLLPSRTADRLGLAVAAAHFGRGFRRASAAAAGGRWEDWEIAVELTYHARVLGWLTLQPDVQYVVHPGGDPALDDALVLGLRATVAF